MESQIESGPNDGMAAGPFSGLVSALTTTAPAVKTGTLLLPETQAYKTAYRAYKQLVERTDMELLRASRETITDNHSISMISAQIQQEVRNHRGQFVSFILGNDIKGYEMAKSSVNTAILSALIARELKLPNHKTLNIIIGALLHDAGMLRIPRDIVNKRGELSDAERQRIHSHPVLAYRIVTKELHYQDEVGKVVLQHHERWDGKGYPYGHAGEQIDKGARIVSIADAFEAMVSQKSYRNPMLGYQAIKNLLADNSRRFDPGLLKVFVGIMGIYPIGSIVCLNNGVVARVAEIWPNAPIRPKTQVLIDKDEKAPAEEVYIDLLLEKNLFITKAITAKEFAELNA